MENITTAAKKIGTLLEESQAIDVQVLDVQASTILADFFVIATVNSRTHAHGLEKHIKEYTKTAGLQLYHTKRKAPDGDEWKILDFGTIIVHLMNKTARKFYDLERLWYEAPNVFESQEQ